MKVIQKISILTLLAVFASAYADDRYSFQIVNNTTDKVFKHCRVSPSGDEWYESVRGHGFRTYRDYLHYDRVNMLPHSQMDKYRDVIIEKLGPSFSPAYTCDIDHTYACDGYAAVSGEFFGHSALSRPDIHQNTYGKRETAVDDDLIIFRYELNMRYSTAQYHFPHRSNEQEVNYKGWSAYNVSLAPGGSFVQGIINPAPLLQIECDLYDQKDLYLTTFGFVLQKDSTPRFFNGGYDNLNKDNQNPEGSMLTYKINYRD